METELNNLRKVVESRTVAKIRTPHMGWGHVGSYIDSYQVEYIAGCDENEIVKELSAEVEKLKEEKQELKQTIRNLEGDLRWLNDQKDDWKKLPWYKKIFIK